MKATKRPALRAALALALAVILALSACMTGGALRDGARPPQSPIVIQEQGSFAVGGTVVRSAGTYDPARPGPEGQTLHGNHARVFYHVPANPRHLPLVMWHGFGQFGKTWETTPDGREGFQTLFLHRPKGEVPRQAQWSLKPPMCGCRAPPTAALSRSARIRCCRRAAPPPSR